MYFFYLFFYELFDPSLNSALLLYFTFHFYFILLYFILLYFIVLFEPSLNCFILALIY